jgi:hypothetical protein
MSHYQNATISTFSSNGRGYTIFCWVLIVAACLLKLINVVNAPIHIDTNLYLNIAQGYFERGTWTPPMWRYNPEWNIITGSGSGYGFIVVLMWLSVFGVSIISSHILMYSIGLLTLPVIYYICKRWYKDPTSALWAVTFFSLTNTFADTFYLRMDALAILTNGLLILYFTLVQAHKSPISAILLGVLCIATLEIHLLSIYCGLAFGVYFLLEYLTGHRTSELLSPTKFFASKLFLFTFSAVVTSWIYFAIHVLPNPSVYFEIPRSIITSNNPKGWKELLRWFVYIGEQPWPLMVLFGLGIGIAIRRRLKEDFRFLMFLTIGILTFLILSPPYNSIYTGHLLPIITLGIGCLWAKLDQKTRLADILSKVAVVIFLLTLIVRIANTSFTYTRTYTGLPFIDRAAGMTPANYQQAVEFIKANVKPDATILGHAGFYLDLFEYRNYLSYWDGEVHGMRLRGESHTDFWKRERPVVYFGAVGSDDEELQLYMKSSGGFTEVTPFVWLQNDLVMSK